MPQTNPVSAVIATRNRHDSLSRALQSLVSQSAQPAEVIVIDASDSRDTEGLCSRSLYGLKAQVIYGRAEIIGAAAQRNQGVASATQPFIWFFDDDIIFEEDCVARLWRAIESDGALGGVNAMITNQRYQNPGRLSRALYRLLDGRHQDSYAGKCVGPALNILPEDDDQLGDVVPAEWLNTTCTIYRREALPSPAFDSHFTGYSLMEDLALSLTVGKKWKLANARTARIYHDSPPAKYKSNQAAMAKMELINRYWIMTRILERSSATDYAKLALLEAFGIVTPLVSPTAFKHLPSILLGKAGALRAISRLRSDGMSDGVLATTRKGVVPN